MASTQSNIDPRVIGLKSFALGYARDAIKYLQQAHEINPDDAEVMLKLAEVAAEESGLFVPPEDVEGFRELASRICSGNHVGSLLA